MEARSEAAPGVPTQEVNLRYLKSSGGEQLVVVDVRVKPPDPGNSKTIKTIKTIKALGGTIIEDVPQFNAIHAALPRSQIEALAALDDVRFISPARSSAVRRGAAHRTPLTPRP